MQKPILVIKFGTASITLASGEPDLDIIRKVAHQVASIHDQYRVIIVSSGAVGAGKSFIKDYKGTITQRKAAASVGNPLLIGIYAGFFAPFNIAIAQSLCERQHFGNRDKFLQLKSTFEELWESNIIPIVNENDVVSDRELKFSDNDELATLIAAGFGAQTLMLCTSVGGLLDSANAIIREVKDVDEVFRFVHKDKSPLGLGGMASKLTYAKMANRMGIKVVIFGLKEEGGILNALEGKTGTLLSPKKSSLSARNRWLSSGGMIAGRIVADEGAIKALKRRKSLLAVGILDVGGEFAGGEIIEIADAEGVAHAVARTRVHSEEIRENLKTNNYEVAHANDIVVL